MKTTLLLLCLCLCLLPFQAHAQDTTSKDVDKVLSKSSYVLGYNGGIADLIRFFKEHNRLPFKEEIKSHLNAESAYLKDRQEIINEYRKILEKEQ